MSARITIHNLGPINDCTMDLEHFTVLTGKQASGKSTVAKAIYFFRTIKDDISSIGRSALSSSRNTFRRWLITPFACGSISRPIFEEAR